MCCRFICGSADAKTTLSSDVGNLTHGPSVNRRNDVAGAASRSDARCDQSKSCFCGSCFGGSCYLIHAQIGRRDYGFEGHRELLKRKITHEKWVSMNTEGY